MSDKTSIEWTAPEVEYRQVEGFVGYRVGNDGSVWTCWRRAGIGESRTPDGPWLLMRHDVGSKGHHRVTLYRSGDPKSRRSLVHHLVLNAFVGPCPAGLECCHGDGDPSNNHVDNLRWDTRVENRADRARHGRARSWSKITLAQVTLARRLRDGGATYAAIGKTIGVSDTQASNIVRGKQWKGAA